MKFKTHLAIGLFLFLSVAFLVQDVEFLFFGVILGAIFPDLDIKTSKSGRRLPYLAGMFKHRGILHSITPAIIFSFLLYLANLPMLGVGFLLGYLSHLAADSLTKKGIRWLYPLKKPVTKGVLRSGGIGDMMVFLFFSAADLILIFFLVF